MSVKITRVMIDAMQRQMVRPPKRDRPRVKLHKQLARDLISK
jgi:hypothetical protein